MPMAAHFVAKLALCIFFVLLLFSQFRLVESKKKPKVKITTESKPSDCTEVAEVGDTLVVHYTGALENGQIFDSSKQNGREPFEITLGQGNVIPGWEQGLLGMCGGEKRNLRIPSDLAYGDRGVEGIIPPKATLIFDIELLELKKKSAMGIIPKGSGFYVALGLVVMLCLGVYELYKRYSKQTEEAKKNKRKARKR